MQMQGKYLLRNFDITGMYYSVEKATVGNPNVGQMLTLVCMVSKHGQPWRRLALSGCFLVYVFSHTTCSCTWASM